MILPALLKILLLGLTMMASSAFAEDALLFDDNGRLPIGFKGDDAEKIYDTTWNIIQTAKAQNIPTYIAANRIAEQRIESIARINAVL